MKAIILAGGLGSRLRPLTDSTPKPLLPVAGKPIIQWQMEWLKNAGVEDFVLSIGHLADKVQAVLGTARASAFPSAMPWSTSPSAPPAHSEMQ